MDFYRIPKELPWRRVSDYSSLSACITDATTDGVGIIIDQNVTISTATTISIPVFVPKGGLFTKSGSGTITFNASFEAGMYQVFSGFSAANITGLDEAKPEWWGAAGDGSTDDTTAVYCAFKSGGHTYLNDNATYIVTASSGASPIFTISSTNFTISGHGTIKLKDSSAFTGNTILQISSSGVVDLSEFTLDSNSSNQTAGNKTNGVVINGASNAFVHGITVNNVPTGVGFSLGDGLQIWSNGEARVIGNRFYNVGRNAVLCDSASKSVTITGNTFDSIGYLAIDMEYDTSAVASGKKFICSDNVITNSYGGMNVVNAHGNDQAQDVIISNNIIEHSATAGREGIGLQDCSNIIVTGNKLKVYNYGIRAYASASPEYASTVVDNITISDNIVEQYYNSTTAVHAIYAFSSHATTKLNRIKIDNNIVQFKATATAADGIVVSQANNSSITNNSIESGEVDGIYFTVVDGLIVKGNTINSPNRYGIIIGATSTNVTIEGNQIINSGNIGLYSVSATAKYININGNIISGCTYGGLLQGLSYVSYTNNTVKNNVGAGIYFNGGTGISVTGNHIFDDGASTQTYGIRFGGTLSAVLVNNNNTKSNTTADFYDGSTTTTFFSEVSSGITKHMITGKYHNGSAWFDIKEITSEYLSGSATWDPGNLVDGAGETSASITVTGAALGDFVVASAPYDLQGITCTAYVDATNSVKIRLQNETTGAIDLASGTWKVKIIKQ